MSLSAFQRRRRELAAKKAAEAAELEATQRGQNINDKPVEKMTVAELKEYAKKNDIVLGEATKKDEILAVILAARHDGSTGGGTDDQDYQAPGGNQDDSAAGDDSDGGDDPDAKNAQDGEGNGGE
ncbi:hypothetical protein [Paenibacillus naphthalenovorans]|uniref:hypothetical protein n=1 Tax=Paenibacillus naphthalenovorans TaxID=162209 RepID=UPI003D27DE89